MGGSNISWTICKSFAPYPRQITTPAMHIITKFSDWMLFLKLNQWCQSTDWRYSDNICATYAKNDDTSLVNHAKPRQKIKTKNWLALKIMPKFQSVKIVIKKWRIYTVITITIIINVISSILHANCANTIQRNRAKLADGHETHNEYLLAF